MAILFVLDSDFSWMSLFWEPNLFHVFRCDNDNKSIVPLEAEVILVLHSVAEANASDESDGVAKQEDEQIGIFQILDKLDEAEDWTLLQAWSIQNWK